MVKEPPLADRYEIKEKIGSGASGSVYLGVDLELEKEVAIKVLIDRLWDDPAARKRFSRECIIVKNLKHPNILEHLDSGTWQGMPFQVLEYCAEGSLADNIEELVNSEEQALDYMLQISEALQKLHEHDIVHRDIKASNVLIGQNGVLKLADFGLARWKSADLSQTNSIGTPIALAPEIWDGKGSSKASDIYALGVLFYHIITGKLPFSTDSIAALAQSHVLSIPDRPSEISTCSPDLELLIGNMMAKKKQDRPGSVHAIIDVLRKIKLGTNETSEPQKPRYSNSFLAYLAMLTIGTVTLGFGILCCLPVDKLNTPENSSLSYLLISDPISYNVIHFVLARGDRKKDWEVYKTVERFELLRKDSSMLWVHTEIRGNARKQLRKIRIDTDTKRDQLVAASEIFQQRGNMVEELWLPFVPGYEKQTLSLPLAQWLLDPRKNHSNMGHLYKIKDMVESNHYLAHSFWDEKNYPRPSFELIDQALPKLPLNFSSLLEPQIALILRHFRRCRKTSPAFPENWMRCQKFEQLILAKDANGHPMGVVLRILGKVKFEEGKAELLPTELVLAVSKVSK